MFYPMEPSEQALALEIGINPECQWRDSTGFIVQACLTIYSYSNINRDS